MTTRERHEQARVGPRSTERELADETYRLREAAVGIDVEAPKKYLTIAQCPVHGFWAVTIDDDDGGYRLTSGKCCGRWDTIRRWHITPDMKEEILKELEAVEQERNDRDNATARRIFRLVAKRFESDSHAGFQSWLWKKAGREE